MEDSREVSSRLTLALAQELADVDTVGQYQRVALGGLARLVPADLWALNDIDPVSGQMLSLLWPADSPLAAHAESVAAVVWYHPLLAWFQRPGDGSPRRLSDVWSCEEYHRSRLYREAYREMGVEFQVAFTLGRAGNRSAVGLAANRYDRDFDDDELRLLVEVRRLLAGAWRRVQALRTLEAAANHASGTGLIVVDDRSYTSAASTLAVTLLARAGIVVAVGEPLPQPLAGWLIHRARLGPVTVGSDPEAVKIELVGGDPNATIVLQITAGSRASDAVSTLTMRERAVLELVAAGATAKDAAAQLEVSPRTIDKHLERIYGKLGVTNRTSAAQAFNSRSPHAG